MGSIASTLEKAGVPVFVIQNDRYEDRMMAGVQQNGLPDIARYMANENLEYTAEGGKKLASIVYPLIVDGLTKWQPQYLKQDGNNWVPTSSTFTYTGATYDEALAKFNAAYLNDMFWGDGLPLTPPTREKVDAMLAATPMTPTFSLGKWGGPNADFTVEKVAVNAVMAGAKPQYFPVILAAMQSLVSFPWQNQTWVVRSPTPLIIVSGPIAQQIKVNSGADVLGANPKYPANSSIARAVHLAMVNIGGSGRGLEPSHLIGPMGGLETLVMAEAEDIEALMGKGWEPLNVQLGKPAGENDVIVMGINNFAPDVSSTITNTAHYIAPNADHWPSTTAAFEKRTVGVMVVTELWGAISSALIPDPRSTIKIHTPTKADMSKFLYEQARIPRAEFNALFLTNPDGTAKAPTGSMADLLKTLKDTDAVPVGAGPNNFLVMVSGGH
jgi:hypothetical protein